MYDTDYYQWTQQQAEALRHKQLQLIDWPNLIEEIEGLGKSEKRKLESYLARLLDHLLKLSFWESEKVYNRSQPFPALQRQGLRLTAFRSHWETKVANFRFEIEKVLKENLSLDNLVEPIWNEIYDKRVKIMSRSFAIPTHSKITLLAALDNDWFPN